MFDDGCVGGDCVRSLNDINVELGKLAVASEQLALAEEVLTRLQL